MGDAILVTGVTGFVGSAVVAELLAKKDVTVHALVRPQAGRTPSQRLESLWADEPALIDALGTRVIAVEGDIEQYALGMDQARYDELARTLSAVVHAAAEVGVNQTEQRYWDVNVRGTYHVLEFARRAHELGGIRRYVHLSTAYVAGRAQGNIPEHLFADNSYNSLYEQSKHEAELLASTYDDLPSAIVRPAQVVGDSRTGFVARFNTLYYPLKQYLRGSLRVIPASPDLRVNMVPVDYVAHLVCRAALSEGLPQHSVLHAVGRPEELPTLGELVETVRVWARDNLDVELPAPLYAPLPAASVLGRARNLRRTKEPKRRGPLRNMLALAPYFFEKRTYEVGNARALATTAFPDWHDYLPRLLAYATRRGFLDHTGRTVAEQILMRLRPGASTRVSYFDVGADGLEPHAGVEVREQITQVANALLASGVSSDTRVATLGVNSVRYFVLDAALNLIGAINVPIYYTSSVKDVQTLVRTSGAALLFVGTDRMLNELDPTDLGIELVCLSDRRDLRPEFTRWQEFLARGVGNTCELPYVSPQQTATIRYTSGTTGMPKGVTFTQQQIRWMGEVMPAVLDWRTRTSHTVRYLSFLPMSHVVEGILVAYAPYYILANIEMYYLTDFPSLARTLPQVRPSIFFSVPRFYEKVWNQFSATGAGRLWMRLPNGLVKRLLAIPLRYVVLRKAGLDRCRQLIVGSAPIGMELLESFRSLGIEIHNAFGVTEAPLITLSRLGNNELGSVGQLLPDTEVRRDDEGLVYVRGPQVTRRYDGMDEPAVDEDGWFGTGDLGSWSDAHNLQLNGRKKEILVTSYGKNIAPQKIEVLLKGIAGVGEAMVVADGRPFVTALLWLEDEVAEALSRGEQDFDFGALDAGVRRVNEQLSHPEQGNRWVVCARPLTVAAGELSPNLKIRRNEVADTRAELVDSLYDAWDGAGAATGWVGATGRVGKSRDAAGRDSATKRGSANQTTAGRDSLADQGDADQVAAGRDGSAGRDATTQPESLHRGEA